MTEQPANTAREAKNIHQALKELLKTKEPFDREVEFQRKNLRKQYLSLLLTHAYAKESKDVENHLWMQTSYAFISSYRQRMLALDRLIQNKSKQQAPPNQRQNNSHVVEHRKLVQRFRQFLADEEKFWVQLLARLRRSFSLNEATPALIALGILSETEENLPNLSEGSSHREGPHVSNGRNQFQFPPEDPSLLLAPASVADKDSRLAILSKALICLGDIARYRELYNESGGRARAGQEERRGGRNRRGMQAMIDTIPRPRNYDKAQLCYEQARLLVPHDGNPSHQLAIIASYQKDSFASLVHYYRALCVRQPYETAAENLSNVLAKAMEQWRNRSRRERERTMEPNILPPRVRIELLKEKVVVMHGLWKVGMEKGIKKMNSISHDFPRSVHDDFFALVSERHLPIDMISSVIVLSQGALWKHRMMSDTIQSRKAEGAVPSEGIQVIIEWGILDHLFDMHLALLEVGKDELKVPPPIDAAENDLAQRITATFRRTLPALRLASKWLRANYKYVAKDPEFSAYQEKKSEEGVDVNRNTTYQISRYSYHTKRYWEVYAEFVRALTHSFPVHRLPPLTAPLEEDIEMRGFLPLKNMMCHSKGNTGAGGSTALSGQAKADHPNDWQLMRIADLISDARELASMADSPIREYGGHIVFDNDAVDPTHQPAVSAHEQGLLRESSLERDDDNLTEITSRTDDDVLRDAFRHLDTSVEDDDDEDKIVWDLGAPISPALSPKSPVSHPTPVTPIKPLTSPVAASTISPTQSKALSPFPTPSAPVHVAPTTAQDLMNDVMSGRATGGALSHLESSVPAPALLFGSHRQGQTIWSASQDERSLKFTSQPNQTYQARQFNSPMVPNSPQSIWSSSYPPAAQDPQHHLVGTLPPSPYVHHNIIPGGHQRAPSLSTVPPQRFPAYYPGPHDPFSHTPLTLQQPIHRQDNISIPAAYLNSPVTQHNGPGIYYENAALPGYHSRHLSYHEPR